MVKAVFLFFLYIIFISCGLFLANMSPDKNYKILISAVSFLLFGVLIALQINNMDKIYSNQFKSKRGSFLNIIIFFSFMATIISGYCLFASYRNISSLKNELTEIEMQKPPDIHSYYKLPPEITAPSPPSPGTDISLPFDLPYSLNGYWSVDRDSSPSVIILNNSKEFYCEKIKIEGQSGVYVENLESITYELGKSLASKGKITFTLPLSVPYDRYVSLRIQIPIKYPVEPEENYLQIFFIEKHEILVNKEIYIFSVQAGAKALEDYKKAMDECKKKVAIKESISNELEKKEKYFSIFLSLMIFSLIFFLMSMFCLFIVSPETSKFIDKEEMTSDKKAGLIEEERKNIEMTESVSQNAGNRENINYYADLCRNFIERRKELKDLNNTRIFIYPHIPSENLKKVREVYAGSEKEEEIFFLYDDSVWGNASDGFCMTEEKLLWHNQASKKNCSINIGQVEKIDLIKAGIFGPAKIIIKNEPILITVLNQNIVAQYFIDLIIDLKSKKY